MDFKIIKNLYKIRDNKLGNSLKEINEVEKKLKIKLPQILLDLYLQFGKNKAIINFDSPKSLEELKINNEGLIEIYCDDMTGETWAIKPKKKDTKLYCKDIDKEWNSEHFQLKDFLFSQIFWASCTGGLEFYTSGNIEDDLLNRKLKENVLKKIGINSKFLKNDYYQFSKNDIININHGTIWVGANNKLDFEKVVSFFGINWIHFPKIE